MPGARLSDFLDLHDNVARRVRNLETGVHPLRADVTFHNSIPPTLLPNTGGSSHLANTATSERHLRYQKRAGIGSLMGQIEFTDPVPDALWGTLPDTMRPTFAHTFFTVASEPPGFATVTVNSDGQVVFHGGSLVGTFAYVSAEGVTWPVT